MSKDYARSLDKIHHKILQDLVKKPENSFCADCAMRGAPSPVLGAGLNVSGLTYRLFSQTRRGPARTSVSTSA